MESLYYSVIGIIAIIVHFIINYSMFFKTLNDDNPTSKNFHLYLISVLLYFITDILWGLFSYFGKINFLYVDTVAYYITMALSIVFCCSYIIAYLKLNKTISKILGLFGICFFIAEFCALIINFFIPIFFYFDESGVYYAGSYRHIALIVQIIMFSGITAISFIVALKKSYEKNRRNKAICMFGIVMTVSIIVQSFYPLMPFYSIGLMVGICILHVYIQEDEKNEQLEVLESLEEIFYSMHVIDLVDNNVVEFYAKNEVKEIVSHRNGADEMMKQVMQKVTTKEYLDAALAFTDLTTVAERMVNKIIISEEFVGNRVGWFLACFITMEADKNGKPTKLIYTTRIIDEIKQQEEKLIYKTKTDEMTGLNNRRAYEEDIYAKNDVSPSEDDFIYISIDVNGLKVINDTKGHLAGDELIVGASQCMKNILGPYGSIYRIGGDEFVAILYCNANKTENILSDFDTAIANWKGKFVDNISVSYGWISKQEQPTASVRELSVIAETRMYEAKSLHYQKIGVDRRGQQDAHKALCELYTKILKINLTEDSYKIVNMDVNEQTIEKGFSDKISEWLMSFGKSGQVHPDDLDEYFRLTDLLYMREYFKKEKTSLSIFYRRKYEDGFKQVMMEIITANDYTDENQNLFLYVKNIDK